MIDRAFADRIGAILNERFPVPTNPLDDDVNASIEDDADEPEEAECDKCGKVVPIDDDCQYDAPDYNSSDGLGTFYCPRCAARHEGGGFLPKGYDE